MEAGLPGLATVPGWRGRGTEGQCGGSFRPSSWAWDRREGRVSEAHSLGSRARPFLCGAL